jgi:hypothetical protein
MSTQLFNPKQSKKVKNLAQILLKLITAHPGTFMAKFDNAAASLGWRARDSTRSG